MAPLENPLMHPRDPFYEELREQVIPWNEHKYENVGKYEDVGLYDEIDGYVVPKGCRYKWY